MSDAESEQIHYEHEVQILLIEDEESDVKLIRRALTKGGLLNTIRVVRDGQEALDYFLLRGAYSDRTRNPLPTLVLLDLKLPKVSGFDVLKEIKTTERLKRIPVVVLTSSNDSQDIDRAYDLGANSYLVKPVQFSAFCEVAAKINLYWLLLNERPAAGDT